LKFLPRVLSYLRPYWRLASFSIVLTVLAALTGLLAPWPLKIVIDHVLGNEPLPAVLAFPWLGREKVTLLIAAVVAGLLVTMLHHAIAVAAYRAFACRGTTHRRGENGIVLHQLHARGFLAPSSMCISASMGARKRFSANTPRTRDRSTGSAPGRSMYPTGEHTTPIGSVKVKHDRK